MKIIARILTRLRRPAPAYRGWQDFELGTYVTDPAPAANRSTPAVTLHDLLPDLLPWQEELLRVQGWDVRNRMLQANRRPEDARITIHGDPAPEHARLTVYGIPVRLLPNIPIEEMLVEVTDRIGVPPPGWVDNSVAIRRVISWPEQRASL